MSSVILVLLSRKLELENKVSKILVEAGMKLYKYNGNNKVVRGAIGSPEDNITKVLGIIWNSKLDNSAINASPERTNVSIIISSISK